MKVLFEVLMDFGHFSPYTFFHHYFSEKLINLFRYKNLPEARGGPGWTGVVGRDPGAPLQKVSAAVVLIQHHLDEAQAVMAQSLFDGVLDFSLRGHPAAPALAAFNIENLDSRPRTSVTR